MKQNVLLALALACFLGLCVGSASGQNNNTLGSAAPSGSCSNQTYFDTTNGNSWVCKGTTWQQIGASGSGTVTSVSSGNLTGLFTSSVANPTTTPAISFSLSLPGSSGQLLYNNAGAVGAEDPVVSYAYANLLNAASATATQTSALVRLSTFSGFGNIYVTYASITGSPSGCTLQLKNADSLGNLINNGSAISTSPSNGTTTTAVASASGLQSSAQLEVVYACTAYPATGTISVDYAPEVSVGIVNTPPVAQSGTWTVQPGNTANTTAWLVTGTGGTFPVTGTVTANAGTGTFNISAIPTGSNTVGKFDLLGNAGAAMDAAGQNVASPANELLVGAQFNTTPTTVASGNISPLQMDSAGNLLVNIKAGAAAGGTSSNFAAAFPSAGTAIGVKNGSNMVNLAADASNNLLVNCATGCAAAGDTTTASTALGALNNVITLALAGERGATFQLQSGGTGVYTVTPQCSFDGGTIYNSNGYIQDPFTGAPSTTATIASAQATTDYPIMCPQGSSNAQMKVTAYTSGTANWLARSTVITWPETSWGVITTSAPSYTTGQIGPASLTTSGALRVDLGATSANATAVKVDGSGVTQPVSGTVTANAGTGTFTTNDTTLDLAQASTTSGQKGPLVQGAVTTSAPTYTTAQTDPLSLTTAGALRVDGSGVTQPVSGTVTANIGTSGSLALDASVSGLSLSQGATTSGQKAALVEGAVTTSAPTYTTADSSPLSLTTAGALRTDASATTQPVSGTVTANAGTGTFNIQADASVNNAQVAGATISTSATGVQKVGVVGNAGASFDAATGAAPPANAILAGGIVGGATGGFLGGIPVCDSYAVVNISTATTTLIVTGVSGRQVRICSANLVTAAANNVAVIEGTGATCGTGTAGMAGGTTAATGWNFAANGGLTLGGGIGTVMRTATAGDSVCIATSAATQLSGGFSYVIY